MPSYKEAIERYTTRMRNAHKPLSESIDSKALADYRYADSNYGLVLKYFKLLGALSIQNYQKVFSFNYKHISKYSSCYV